MSSPLRVILQNFSKVMCGQMAVTTLGFFALAMNTRALGIEDLGKLFLVQATCELVSKLISFQNWQSFAKVGADIEGRGSLKALWLYGVGLDFAAATLSAFVVATLLIAAPSLLGLDPETAKLGLYFAAALVFSGRGTSIGALRLLGAFGWAVSIDVLQAVLLLLNAFVLYRIGADLPTYLITIPVVSVLASLLVLFIAWRKIEAQEDVAVNERFDRVARQKFLSFAFGVSASSALNAIRQRGEILIVGAILGPSAAALFGVAYRLAALLARFAEAARISVYPEFSRLASSGHFFEAARLAFRITKMAVLVSVFAFGILVVFGVEILSGLFGAEFSPALPILLLLASGTALYASAFSLTSLTQITFGSWRFFKFNLIAFACFVLGAILGPYAFGVNGAGAGALAYSIILVLLCGHSILYKMRDEKGGIL
ncbi:lipopolysaccharide biosynthesis protein [Planktotalea sp.]|uniref:lipopolysaccharide biosynthesis protein n=1 Tax=Planktotalea sp. TaxID=2029877 RepID=UPI00329A6735